MDSRAYCRLMMNFKSNGPKFSTFMGTKWVVSKFIILLVGGLMVFNEDKTANIIGYILFGYFLGLVLANIRVFILSKNKWELQKEFIDWGKIEEVVAQNKNNENHSELKSKDEQKQ